MKNYIKTGLFLLFPGFLWAQNGLLNNGAAIEVTESTTIHIVGDMQHQADGKVINEGIIKVEKDWIQSSKNTLYTGSGWMSFVGKTNQEISSTSPLTIPNLRVDNNNTLLLNTALNISNQVDLSHNGNISLEAHDLIINTGATIVNYDENNYVITNNIGVLQQEVSTNQVVFPIGNSSYNPAMLSNQGTVDNFRLRVLNYVEEMDENSVNRTWLIEEETVGGSLVSLDLQWNEEEELNNFSRNQSALVNWTGTNWASPSNSTEANSTEGYWLQTRSNLTSFSAFTVHSNLLFSQIVTESISANIEIFPNPVKDHFNIRLHADIETAFIQVFDSKGSIVFQTNKSIGTDGLIHLSDIRHFADGVYWVHIVGNDGLVFSKKIIKE